MIENICDFLGSWEATIRKRNEETLGVDGYVYYLDSSDGFTGVCMYQNASNFMPKICPALYVNYTLIKLFWKGIRVQGNI